jgi:hypothetical protein
MSKVPTYRAPSPGVSVSCSKQPANLSHPQRRSLGALIGIDRDPLTFGGRGIVRRNTSGGKAQLKAILR